MPPPSAGLWQAARRLFLLAAIFIPSPALLAAGVTVEFHLQNDWGSGYTAEIEMRNDSAAPVDGWTLEFDLAGSLVHLWNGEYSRNHTHTVVRSLSWNSKIQPGAVVKIGFQGAYSGVRPEPTNCRFNGVSCTFTGDTSNPEPPPSEPPPTEPPPTEPPPPPPPTPSEGAVVEWNVVNSWNSGYTAEAKIVNKTGAPIDGWTLKFELSGGIANLWNGKLTKQGATYAVTNLSWNAGIPINGSVSFGFNGQRANGEPIPAPTQCLLNGQACTFAPAGTAPPPEPPAPTPLSANLTSPAAGAWLSGTATLTAAVQGDGVERVEFLAGGTLIGSDASSPYALAWDTTTVPDGQYDLRARAVRGAEAVLSPVVAVTVAQPVLPPPPPPPSGPSSFLSVVGAGLVDESGQPVRLTGVNWFGFETSVRAPHGLWARDYRSMLHQVHDLGFNTIRLPWSNGILEPGAAASSISFAPGPDPFDGRSPMNAPLAGKSPLEILDLVIEEAGRLGLKIVLDNHSRKPDNFAAEGLWYLPDFPEQRWTDDWVKLANRYKNNPTVVAFDLHNEPHDPATWGGAAATNWPAAAERAAAAIHAVHPDVILIVGGVQTVYGVSHWWGGNLRGVRERPVQIDPRKLLYSAHDYGPEVFNQTWFSASNFPANLAPLWDETWGYIPKENRGAVFIGEFGIKDPTAFGGRTLQWFQALLGYMGASYNWTFWSLNPNSGDTGGILQSDWISVEQWKVDLLEPYLAPQFPVAP